MVISSRVQSTFFAPAFASTQFSKQSPELIRLPLSVAPQYETRCEVTGEILPTHYKPLFRTNLWSTDEHERFLHGLELFPTGPWKEVANVVGTKTTRQTRTHAQKYRQKIERRQHAKPGVRKAIKSGVVATGKPLREVLYSVLQDGSISSPSPATASSPSEPWHDIFDTTSLDDEFHALISSLQPLSSSPDEPSLQELLQW